MQLYSYTQTTKHIDNISRVDLVALSWTVQSPV